MDIVDYKEVSTLCPHTDHTAKRNVGVVVTCISEKISLGAAEWTLFNLLTAGDLLILLAIYNDTGGYHALAQGWDTNRTAEEVEKTTSVFESSCREKRVFFELRSKAGDVKSVILEEVNSVHASLVTLDRNLKLKQGEDMKVIQESLTCRVFMMPNSDDVNFMHKPVDAENSNLLDEVDEALLGSQSTICTQNSVNSGLQADACSTPWYMPSVGSPPGFPVVETPCSFADSFRISTGGSSLSLPGKLPGQSTPTSSSSTPSNIRKPIPRSASDSNFRTRAAASLFESGPGHTLIEKPSIQTRRPYDSGQVRSKKSLEMSLDVFQELAESYTIPEIDAFEARDRPSYLAGNLEKQIQDYPHRQQVTRAAFQQQRISYSMENSGGSLYKNFPQGGRSILCSGCKQMSPVLRNIPRRFSYVELEVATDNFSQKNFLAEGGFGFVYKGELNGQYLAVKQHKLASTQGYKEFRSEVELLSCAQHRNLVMLLGCCDENGHRMLVYEFVCNKSLDWHLSPAKNPKGLEWAARLKIAIGAGRALRYLHEECRVGCIVHRDMRPNNILLTHDYEPMVGDFGLARSNPEGEEPIETRIIGTFGYLAPEYAESGQVSWKADVYAFGVVLLELITGRKAIDLLRPPGQQSLTEWARPRLLSDAMFAELVDTRLENFYASEMRAMMSAAYHCIQKDAAARPRMSQVLHILEGESRGFEEVSRQAADLYPASKISDLQTLNIQQPAAAATSFKSQIRKQQSGNSSSSSNSRKPKLHYGDML